MAPTRYGAPSGYRVRAGSLLPPELPSPPEQPEQRRGRSRHRSLPRQFTALATGRGAAGILSAAWLVVAARALAPAAFGNLAILLAVGSMGGVLSDLGQQTALAHATAEASVLARPLLLSVIRRRLIQSMAAIAAIVVLYGVASSHSTLLVPLLFTGSIVGTVIYSTEIAALTAIGRAHVDGANEAMSRLGVLVVGWWWLHHGGGLFAAVSVYVAADLASAVVVSLVVRRHWSTSTSTSTANPIGNDRRFRIRNTAPLAFALTAAVVYARVDTWLLGQMQGSVLAGHYAAADKILDAVLLAPAALGALSIAQVSPLPSGRRWKRIELLAGLAVGLAVLPALAIGLFANRVIGGLFGAGFRSTGPVLVVLLISVVPGAVVAACSPITAVLARWSFAAAMAGGLVVNVALNVALIPHFRAEGAAWVNLASEALLAAWMLVLLARETRTRPTG